MSPIYPDNMLACVAAHLLTHRDERCHITDMQLVAACETQTTFEVWATEQGLATVSGEFRGYSGFWLYADSSNLQLS